MNSSFRTPMKLRLRILLSTSDDSYLIPPQFWIYRGGAILLVRMSRLPALTTSAKDLLPYSLGVMVKSIVDWRDFYLRTYIFVGKLVGRYYDGEGNPTKYLKGIEAKAARGAQLLEKQKKEEAKIPNCNSKWSREEGSEVWCDEGHPRLDQRPLEIALTGKNEQALCLLQRR
ncbi:hypothetical protein ACS0TY_025542 [Phlomoides rotata]